VTETLVEFLRRWGELGPTSAAVLVLVFVVGGLMPFPRTFLTLAAGVVYGMASVLVIMPATTAGCLIAFLIARYLFADWLRRAVQDRPRLVAIITAVEAEGWRIVALCRLASPIPSSVQSALFGLTRIRAWTFTWSTFLFTIPQITLYAYLGSIGKAALLGETGSVHLGVMAAGGVTFLAVILVITRRVRASMRELGQGATLAR